MEQIRIMIYAQKQNILKSKIIQEYWINHTEATILTRPKLPYFIKNQQNLWKKVTRLRMDLATLSPS